MSDSAVEAIGLSVERGDKRVLDDVSFNVAPGEIFALLGGNGAGKSTALLTLLGFLTPSAGAARVLGAQADENPATVRDVCAYLPEMASLYAHLNAWENIDYFLSLGGLRPDREAVAAALDRVALPLEARDNALGTYSKGMRQKVAIALAVLRQAPVLLLDEPTSGLDPVAIDEFNTLISSLAAEGAAIVMVTHDVYGACQVAKRVGLLRRGALVGLFEAPEGGKIDAESLHTAFSRSHAE
ncbi:MAG: ABC transporter ATP-binding protein [Pseudomonadota bacterium]